jgi:uncharacterized protein (DUF302 family)
MSLTASSSPHSVAVTADRAVAALERRGITLFTRVDHASGAHAVGLALEDEQLLIFGDPRAGTPLMQADPRVGYELPLRLLIWDANGQTMVAYRPAGQLSGEYDLADHAAVLERMEGLLEQVIAESVAARVRLAPAMRAPRCAPPVPSRPGRAPPAEEPADSPRQA